MLVLVLASLVGLPYSDSRGMEIMVAAAYTQIEESEVFEAVGRTRNLGGDHALQPGDVISVPRKQLFRGEL